jgi:hypothetical protein
LALSFIKLPFPRPHVQLGWPYQALMLTLAQSPASLNMHVPHHKNGDVLLRELSLSFLLSLFLYLFISWTFLTYRGNIVSDATMCTSDCRERMWEWVIMACFKELQTQRNLKKK